MLTTEPYCSMQGLWPKQYITLRTKRVNTDRSIAPSVRFFLLFHRLLTPTVFNYPSHTLQSCCSANSMHRYKILWPKPHLLTPCWPLICMATILRPKPRPPCSQSSSSDSGKTLVAKLRMHEVQVREKVRAQREQCCFQALLKAP